MYVFVLLEYSQLTILILILCSSNVLEQNIGTGILIIKQSSFLNFLLGVGMTFASLTPTRLGCIFRRNNVCYVTFLSYPAELRYPIPPENGKGKKRNSKGMFIHQRYSLSIYVFPT